MQTEPFDAIIIGAGQAGPAIAARCSKEGLHTVVIERHHFGGTCVNVGCVPTKTLVASARAVRQAQRGAEFGFDTGDIRVDMARVKARKDGIVMASRQGVETWMRGLAHTEVIAGDARFVAAGTVEVNGRRLSAPRIFLNVGGRSVRPDLKGIDSVAALDNVSIMELSTVPEHLVIVGGSYIGLEFAQMMRRFGAEVTVVERLAQLLPREDADVSEGIRNILQAEGVRFELGADCLSLAPDDPRRISHRIACYALFIDPALGRIGMNEAEARASGRKLLRAKMPMQRVGRAREASETQGFKKVLVDADTQRLLGAAILGLNGDEVVHSLLEVMAADQPYTVMSRAVHIHPTVTELVPTLLQQLKPMG